MSGFGGCDVVFWGGLVELASLRLDSQQLCYWNRGSRYVLLYAVERRGY